MGDGFSPLGMRPRLRDSATATSPASVGVSVRTSGT